MQEFWAGQPSHLNPMKNKFKSEEVSLYNSKTGNCTCIIKTLLIDNLSYFILYDIKVYILPIAIEVGRLRFES
jgi:hypothetical protein